MDSTPAFHEGGQPHYLTHKYPCIVFRKRRPTRNYVTAAGTSRLIITTFTASFTMRHETIA